MSDETPAVVEEATAIYDSVRAICHMNSTHPAPTVYQVLGNLKGATGSMLGQALRQLATSMERSLNEYDVYEDDGSDPQASVNLATAHMLEAAALADLVGESLAKAQNAIAKQGYREPTITASEQERT